jgi:undecaprenyl-diphosphatase
MDVLFQALVMGVVQGLTEFVPISSSGHLIIVPYLAGWTDPFLTSLAFSVMLHIGTIGALLVYFRDDWLRLIPAGLAAIRDRSFRGDEDRRLAWLLVATTIPAAVVGLLFGDVFETTVRSAELVAVMLVAGGLLMWFADRFGARSRAIEDLTFPTAGAIGAAQALALIPGVSRSGVTISAGRLVGMDREPAARFAFLMSMPVTVGAALVESRKLITGESGVDVSILPLVVGMLGALIAGLLAIHFMLNFLRRRSLNVFVVYRFVLAAIVLAVALTR